MTVAVGPWVWGRFSRLNRAWTEYNRHRYMLIVHVHIRVKPEFVNAFIEATTENARHSIQEPGIARFDFLTQSDDPNLFVLIEVYRSPGAVEQHRATAHYAKWRDTVAEMMAEPRSRVEYSNVFPGDEAW